MTLKRFISDLFSDLFFSVVFFISVLLICLGSLLIVLGATAGFQWDAIILGILLVIASIYALVKLND